jgi:hypothetical protein
MKTYTTTEMTTLKNNLNRGTHYQAGKFSVEKNQHHDFLVKERCAGITLLAARCASENEAIQTCWEYFQSWTKNMQVAA